MWVIYLNTILICAQNACMVTFSTRHVPFGGAYCAQNPWMVTSLVHTAHLHPCSYPYRSLVKGFTMMSQCTSMPEQHKQHCLAWPTRNRGFHAGFNSSPDLNGRRVRHCWAAVRFSWTVRFSWSASWTVQLLVLYWGHYMTASLCISVIVSSFVSELYLQQEVDAKVDIYQSTSIVACNTLGNIFIEIFSKMQPPAVPLCYLEADWASI